MGNKGITLVSLVITIIVMLILAGVSLSMLVGDGSVLDQAKNASTSTVLASIKEEFELNKTGRKMKEVVNANGKINKEKDTGIYAMGTDVLNYIPNIDKGYIGKVGIFNDELVFVGEELTEEDKAAAQGMGYTLMDEGDYIYMSLMKKMETLVKGKDTSKGTALNASNFHEIAGIKYGTTWYEISASQLSGIGFSPEEIEKFKEYAPFVVRFDSGAVLSKIGKKMYAGTDMEIVKYTFNYTGEKDGVVITDLMAGVDKNSVKKPEQWGAFSPAGGSGKFTIDASDNNAVKLGEGVIGELKIDQSISINKVYSINVTVKCDVDQNTEMRPAADAALFPDGLNSFHNGIISISDLSGQYVCWLGVDRGYLRVYNFRDSVYGTSWSTAPNGYMSVDIKEYDDQIMNIQFTAERGGQAKIYINGELKAIQAAGTRNFSYKTLTIGDLRKGRGLLFEGKMYDMLIYGRILTEAEVMQNYQAIKKQLNF